MPIKLGLSNSSLNTDKVTSRRTRVDTKNPSFLNRAVGFVDRTTRAIEKKPVLGFPSRLIKGPGDAIARYAGEPDKFKQEVAEPLSFLSKEPGRFATRMGESASLPFTTKRFEKTQEQTLNQSDLFLNKAIEANRAGKKELADKYFQASRETTDRARGSADERLGKLEEGKKELVRSGLNTARLAGIAYNPAASLKMGGAGALLSSGLSALSTEPRPEAFGEGFVGGVKMSGFTNISNPIISGLIGKYASTITDPTTRKIISKTLSGVGEVIEDRIIDKIDGVDRTILDDVFSFTLAAIMAGEGKAEDWDKLKKELTTGGIGGSEAKDIIDTARRAASRLKPEVKYQELMTGEVAPKVVFTGETTTQGVGRDVDRLLTRQQAIKEGYEVLEESAENIFKKQSTQGGFATLPGKEQPGPKIEPKGEQTQVGPRSKITEGERERTFLKRLEESPEIEKELKTELETLPQTYKVESRIQAQEAAQQLAKTDLEGTIEKFDSGDLTGQEKVVTGYALLDELQQSGRNSEARRIADEMTSELTQAGRTVEAAKVLTRLDGPSFQLKIKKIFDEANKRKFVFGDKAKMTDDLVEKITKTMDQVKATDDELEKLRLVRDLLDKEISPQIPPGSSELIDAFRHNNMLSNPKSWLKNISGNTMQALIIKPVTMAFEAPIDFAKSLLTGSERQTYINDVPKYYKNLFNAAPNGMTAFVDTMKDPTFLDMEDGFLTTSSLERYLQAKRTPGALTIGSRPMEAFDKMFSVPMAATEKARLMDLGLDEKEAETQAKELAERWLFRAPLDPNNKSGQGYLLSSIDQGAAFLRTGTQKIKPLGWLAPYINTPTQIVKQLIEFSPAGLATVPGTSTKRTTEQLAKTIAGSLAMWAGSQVVLDAQTTWAVPRDEEQRTLFYEAGMKPYSVKIGNKWIPYAYLGAFGLALAVPAAHKYYHEQSPRALTDTEIEKLQKTIADTADFLANQTSVPSLLETIQIVMGQSDRKIGDVAGFAATQVLPFSGMMRFVSQIFDPIYRQADGLKENIQRSTPFKTRLDPYLTSEGEPSTRTPLEIFTPYGMGVDNPEVREKLDMIQRLERVRAVPNWFQRESNKIRDDIQEINRNQSLSEEEKQAKTQEKLLEIDELVKRFQELTPQMERQFQPTISSPPNRQIQTNNQPVRIEPTPTSRPTTTGRLSL